MTTHNRQQVSAAPGSNAFAYGGERFAIGLPAGTPKGECEWAAVATSHTRLAAQLT